MGAILPPLSVCFHGVVLFNTGTPHLSPHALLIRSLSTGNRVHREEVSWKNVKVCLHLRNEIENKIGKDMRYISYYDTVCLRNWTGTSVWPFVHPSVSTEQQ